MLPEIRHPRPSSHRKSDIANQPITPVLRRNIQLFQCAVSVTRTMGKRYRANRLPIRAEETQSLREQGAQKSLTKILQTGRTP